MPSFLNRCWEFKLRTYACTTGVLAHWAISLAPFIIWCHLSPGTALDLSLCCQLHSGLTLFAWTISPPFAPSLFIPFQGLWVSLVWLDLDISFWVQRLYVLWLEFNLSMPKAIIDRELSFSCFLPCMSSFVPLSFCLCLIGVFVWWHDSTPFCFFSFSSIGIVSMVTMEIAENTIQYYESIFGWQTVPLDLGIVFRHIQQRGFLKSFSLYPFINNSR